MAALLVGIVIATWQAVVASRAESKARASAAESNAVLEFLENYILAAARPEGKDGGLGRDVSLKQALEAALPRVDASFAQQPLVEARLRMTLGTSFRYLGDADVAARQFERARKIYDELLGPESSEALTSMDGLASAYADLDREPEALACAKRRSRSAGACLDRITSTRWGACGTWPTATPPPDADRKRSTWIRKPSIACGRLWGRTTRGRSAA